MKLFYERYVCEDRKACIGQRNLDSRNTVQCGTPSTTPSIMIFAARPTIRSHTTCTTDSDAKWTANKRTMPIRTQQLILLTNTSPSSCVFKTYLYIFFIVPTNAHYTHFKTLKSHIKILNNHSYIIRSHLKPSTGSL
jgi:hypothetical protein